MMEQLRYERLLIAVFGRRDHGTRRRHHHAVREGPQALRRYADEPAAHALCVAECKTEAHIGRVFLDSCIERLMAGTLDTATASMAKWWLTTSSAPSPTLLAAAWRLRYMVEYRSPGSGRQPRAAHLRRRNEIMKELVARSL